MPTRRYPLANRRQTRVAAVLLAGLVALITGLAPAAAVPAWPTYHQNGERWGAFWEPPVRAMRTAWTSPALDGDVYAEPLFRGGTVYVATEGDWVYALSLRTGRVRWSRRLGVPEPLARLACGDINPLGVTGTPVLQGRELYVAAETEGARHRLFALDANTGRILRTWPLDPPGSSPAYEQQRGALAFAYGRVYVPLGGLYGDCGPYHGYVVGVPVQSRGPILRYEVPSTREAGIWAPSGVTIGARGGIFVATGNGASTTRYDEGDSVIALTPDLRVRGVFAPPDWADLNAHDLDLGATGPLWIPPGRLFQIGKDGVGYLLPAGRLPGIGHALAHRRLCDGAYGAEAYASGRIFVACVNGLFAVRATPGRITPLWAAKGFWSGPPVVGGGTVFVVDQSTRQLRLYRAGSGRPIARALLPATVHFDAPALAPHRVLVPAGNRVVAFRLLGVASG